MFLGLLAVGMISVIGVYVFVTRVLLHVDGMMISRLSESVTLTVELREEFAKYYSKNGGWEGVAQIFEQQGETDLSQWEQNVLLIDIEGNTLYTSSQESLREKVPSKLPGFGLPIYDDGHEVAQLYTKTMLDRFSKVKATLRKSAIGIMAYVFVVAMGMNSLLLRVITTPLRRLVKATRTIVSGDLANPVRSERTSRHVSERDEIGRLSNVLEDLRIGLARSEEIRQRMLTDIAHELRNPLAILRAKVEAMLDGIQPADEGNLAVLNDRLLHLSHLVNELQDVALAEANELPLEQAPVDLATFLHELEQDVQPFLKGTGKHFQLEIFGSPPAVYADRRRLLQIMWNLLTNAFRHTMRGDSITVQVSPCADTVLVRILDTGEGMDEETLEHIFDRFYRGNQGHTSEGLGLGLAITKGLVRAHDGEISVESHAGKGTKFSFSLPIHHRDQWTPSSSS